MKERGKKKEGCLGGSKGGRVAGWRGTMDGGRKIWSSRGSKGWKKEEGKKGEEKKDELKMEGVEGALKKE